MSSKLAGTGANFKSSMPPILLGLIAGLIIWAMLFINLLQPVSKWSSDLLLSRSVSSSSYQVVLLHWPTEIQPDIETLKKTVHKLHELGTAQVVLTFTPSHEILQALDQNRKEMKLLVGALRPLKGDDPPFGIVVVPQLERGIARRQHVRALVDARAYPTLEIAAARQRLGREASLPDESFLVRFQSGGQGLPTVKLNELLNDRLIAELVRGKTVLIGAPLSPPQIGLATPANKENEQMSLLEFQGHALSTLLSQQAIRPLSPFQTLTLCLLSGILVAMIFQWLTPAWMLRLALVVSIITVVICYWLFISLSVLMPVAEILLIQWLALFLLVRQRAAHASRQSQALMQQLTSTVSERHFPPGFYEIDEHWSLLLHFVTQALDARRMIFLEAISGKHRLKEIAALGCSISDIQERRRDFSRAPYQTALERGAPIRLDLHNRPFFTDQSAEELVYLCPLTFGGDVLGFWAVSLPALEAEPRQSEALLRDFSEQIAELLYHRHLLQTNRTGSPLLGTIFTQTPEMGQYRSLSSALELLTYRLNRIERFFAESSLPSIDYDLFGRVRDVNPAMLDLLTREGILPFEIGLPNLIAELTGHELSFARQCMRALLVNKQRLALPVSLKKDGGRHFLLRLYPLEISDASRTEAVAFSISGIGCELIDRTSLVRLQEMKGQLAERVGQHLRNDLASVELSTTLLTEGALSEQEREEVAQIVNEKVQEIMGTLKLSQNFFEVDLPSEGQRLPVNGPRTLQSALTQLHEELAQAEITVQVDVPPLINDILASPDYLQLAIVEILRLLIRDARPQSRILIVMEETANLIRLTFANQGFGMPQERLTMLLGQSETESDELRPLCKSLERVREWGGHVRATSELGEGIVLSVELIAFG